MSESTCSLKKNFEVELKKDQWDNKQYLIKVDTKKEFELLVKQIARLRGRLIALTCLEKDEKNMELVYFFEIANELFFTRFKQKIEQIEAISNYIKSAKLIEKKFFKEQGIELSSFEKSEVFISEVAQSNYTPLSQFMTSRVKD